MGVPKEMVFRYGVREIVAQTYLIIEPNHCEHGFGIVSRNSQKQIASPQNRAPLESKGYRYINLGAHVYGGIQGPNPQRVRDIHILNNRKHKRYARNKSHSDLMGSACESAASNSEERSGASQRAWMIPPT